MKIKGNFNLLIVLNRFIEIEKLKKLIHYFNNYILK